MCFCNRLWLNVGGRPIKKLLVTKILFCSCLLTLLLLLLMDPYRYNDANNGIIKSSNDSIINYRLTSPTLETKYSKISVIVIGFLLRFWARKSITTENINLSKVNNQVILMRNPYASDPECKSFFIRLYEENYFNLTALVSYPGSGNTWVRHLIQMATGIYTGSVYFDEQLFAGGFVGEKEEWNSGMTIVQKLHSEYNSNYDFHKAILIVREPFSAIVSFVHYMESGHKGNASPITFRKKEWPYYILSQVHQWITIAKSWMESTSETLVVHYENIRQNPTKELQRMCNFVNISCTTLDGRCFKKHLEGSFHRKTSFRTFPPPPYPEWVRNKVDDGIDYLNNLLKLHKQTPLPLNLYKFYRKS